MGADSQNTEYTLFEEYGDTGVEFPITAIEGKWSARCQARVGNRRCGRLISRNDVEDYDGICLFCRHSNDGRPESLRSDVTMRLRAKIDLLNAELAECRSVSVKRYQLLVGLFDVFRGEMQQTWHENAKLRGDKSPQREAERRWVEFRGRFTL